MTRLSPGEIARIEVENGFRQLDAGIEMIEMYCERDRPFALRPSHILHLHELACEGLQSDAGQWRSSGVILSGRRHKPPEHFRVPFLVQELCDYVNGQLHEKSAFFLASYIMWRLNWIHPFSDGNGRTSRVLSYVVLCIRLGYVLPGRPTIPELVEANRNRYLDALAAADGGGGSGEADDVSALETMLREMLATQLLSVIRKADGT